MKIEKCYELPNYYKYLPFDVAIFIHLSKNGGILYAIKSLLSMKFITLIKWMSNHNKRFRNYIMSKAKSPFDLLILQLFLSNTYDEKTIDSVLKEVRNLNIEVK